LFYVNLFVNGTTMGVFCGRSVQNVFYTDLPTVLDDLVLSLVIGTYFGCFGGPER